MDPLLHIAERVHWDAALSAGRPYAMSTLRRTLAEEGFIHCSADEHQAASVLARFYTDVPHEDLILLVIDPTALDAPVHHEPADGHLFPHVYGPIPTAAVIETRPLPEPGKLLGGGFA